MGRTRAPSTDDRDDPLLRALAPPPDESPAARAARLRAEALAKKRSDEIDARLQAESAAAKRKKGRGGDPIKLLLLGQSESGKSTTLKNFQLTYARKAWLAEKEAWRAVIQLNLVRSVNAIAAAISRELDASTRTSASGSFSPMDQEQDRPELDHEMDMETDGASILTSPEAEAPHANANEKEKEKVESELTITLTSEHRALIARLGALRTVQRSLEVKLGSGAEELDGNNAREGNNENENENEAVSLADADADVDLPDPAHKRIATTVSFRDITNDPSLSLPSSNTNTNSNSKKHRPGSSSVTGSGSTSTAGVGVGAGGTSLSGHALLRSRKSQEFFVRSHGWKTALQRLRARASRSSRDGKHRNGNNESENGDGDADADVDANGDGDGDAVMISRCARDMKILWKDRAVRELVKAGRVRLLDCAEFFLSSIDRIASPSYTPSDADVIRARLRTVGVQEHTLTLESGPEPGRDWVIYDVGGSRSLRAQWPSYFDDVHAILFLAPISAFDERLEEDPHVNRLDDSMQLWKSVCANKLLMKTELVLFLNKCDLLERKLRNGVRFERYVKSYKGQGENEPGAVGKFLRNKFMEVCRHYSKEHRGLHVHFTSVIDTQATAKTLAAVQDGILRSNLRHLDLI